MRTTKKNAATSARSFRTFLLMQQFDSKAIGQRIAQARRQADGMTQEELADLIGLSKRSVQNFEAGATLPWKHLRAIARVLNKEVDWFMYGDERGEPAAPFEPVPSEVLSALNVGVELLRRESAQQLELLGQLLQERFPPPEEKQS